MAKKRRKLNKELELEISLASKKVELISAKINDIQEEDILAEYNAAFEPVKNTYLLLAALYDTEGYTNQTSDLILNYYKFLKEFEEGYEI